MTFFKISALAVTLFLLVGCDTNLVSPTKNNISEDSSISKRATVVAIAYEHWRFQGNSYKIYSDNLNQMIVLPSSWNDEISSVKIIDPNYGVTFYEHNTGGKETDLNTGIISQRDVHQLPNDSFTAYKVYRRDGLGERFARVYEHSNFRGAYRDIYEFECEDKKYVPNVGSLWNDRISSIEANNSITVYEHQYLEGKQKVFQGSYPYVGDDWNDIITSLKANSLGSY